MIAPTVGAAAYDYPLLIKQLFHTPLLCQPDQQIVNGLRGSYSYRTLRDRVAKLASGLSRLGVTPGQTVAVMDWDGSRYLECFFAIPMLGAVLHTVNVRLSPEQILYTINHAEDDIILVHEDFVPIVAQIADRIDRPIKMIYLNDGNDQTVADNFDTEYETLLATGDAGFVFEDFDEQTRATVFYTTGTTGDPKGVTYSHRQLLLHTMASMAAFGIMSGPCNVRDSDVYMPITPMFYVHAWGFPYVATLAGLKQVYPGKYDPVTLLSLIDKEKVTFSHCVPTILHMLLSAPESADVDLSNWKVIIGGAAMPRGLAELALSRGINVFTGYGMSETRPLLTYSCVAATGQQNDMQLSLDQRCRTGRPAPLVDLRVVDADMNDVPHDGQTTGEVVARSPWLAPGYVKNQAGSDVLWQGGYLHTGDVGFMHPGGQLQITDRIKDVIKSGGEWISSLDLESIASSCPSVSEVAAIGVSDERWGERPMLLVVKVAGAQDGETAETIRQAITEQVDAGRLSRWAVPEKVVFVDALDKTSVGKLNKKALRERYAEMWHSISR